MSLGVNWSIEKSECALNALILSLLNQVFCFFDKMESIILTCT